MDVAVLGEVSVTGLTLNVTTLPVGMPETLSFTFPLKVFRGVRVIGNRADVPALMVSIDVFGLSEKSGEVTTSEREVVCVIVPSVPVTVTV